MSWTYKNNEMVDITQFPENTYGFVYINKHVPTGKSYIGKKILQFTKKVKLGKKELLALTGIVGRRPSYKLMVKGIRLENILWFPKRYQKTIS